MTSPHAIQLAGKTVPYSVHFSGKARLLSLKVSPESGLVIVIPKHLRGTEIDFAALMQKKSRWILHKLERAAALRDRYSKRSFTDGSKFSLMGKEITLRVIQTQSNRALARLEGAALLILTPEADEKKIRAFVVAWFRYVATDMIVERVHAINRDVGFSFNRIIVRDQKSRWGSCSRRGTLSFNWRLLLIPPTVMDYLIFHELAHLKEMNHSVRFWRLVHALCPTFRESERWLNANGRAMFW